MSIRVTNNILQNLVVNGLFRNTSRLRDAQERVSSGNEINRPSDDPGGATDVAFFNTQLSRNAQFFRNLDRGEVSLKSTEAALNNVVHLLTRARELAVTEASGTATANTRAGTAVEVTSLRDQLLGLANSNDGERYLFGGFTVNQAPFVSAGTFQGDTGDLRIQANQQVFVTVNLRGDQIFGGTGGGVNIIQVLNNLITALNSNSATGISTEIGNLVSASGQINFALATVGGRMNELQRHRSLLQEEQISLRRNLSDVRDVDFAKAATDLTNQETLFRSSLAAAASLLRISLLDFLA